MKRKIKIIIAVTYALFTVGNIIPVILLRERAHFTLASILVLVFAAAIIARGIYAYDWRFKYPDLVSLAHRVPKRYHYMMEDSPLSTTDEYGREFYIKFSIYWTQLPFFIPLLFFFPVYWHKILLTLTVIAYPQIIYFTMDCIKASKEIKRLRAEREARQKELREQELREELGEWCRPKSNDDSNAD